MITRGDAHMGSIADSAYDFCTGAFVHRKHLQLIPTGQITENIYAVRTGSVNLFLYKKGSDCIAVDSGYGVSIIKRELLSLGINPNEISGLFLTHSDFDHANGLPVFQNAQIYLSSQEEPLITRKVSRKYGIFYNRNIDRAYKLLHDQDEITIGKIRIRAIEAPGHTPGSMVYLIEDGNLFVGDAFRLIHGKAAPNSPLYCMDLQRQNESIRKLAMLKDIRLVFTAHGGYSDNFSSAMADWR